jgi:hypothetical protein
MAMCGKHCEDVMEWLLDHDLVPNLSADAGTNRTGHDVPFTPMDAAVIDQVHPWILELLERHGGKVTDQALFLTINRGGSAPAPIVNWLLEHGADPNAAIRPWGRILRQAIKRGTWNLVEALLKHGANVMVNSGEDPKKRDDVEYARSLGHNPRIYEALKARADADKAKGEPAGAS